MGPKSRRSQGGPRPAQSAGSTQAGRHLDEQGRNHSGDSKDRTPSHLDGLTLTGHTGQEQTLLAVLPTQLHPNTSPLLAEHFSTQPRSE